MSYKQKETKIFTLIGFGNTELEHNIPSPLLQLLFWKSIPWLGSTDKQ